MTYRVFIPHNELIKTGKWAIQSLAIIASLSAIIAALAGACYVLMFLIHAFSSVCHAAYEAVGGSPATMAMVLIALAMILFIVKLGCLLFPSSFFSMQGVRV